MSEQELDIFAKRLRELRSVAGLTQCKLAKKLNISRSCLANYESRKRRPDRDMVRAIANYFGVQEEYLTGKKQAYISVSEEGYTGHSSSLLSSEGQLDISGVSPAAKIALIEFYNYLMDKSQHGTEDSKQKTTGNDK